MRFLLSLLATEIRQKLPTLEGRNLCCVALTANKTLQSCIVRLIVPLLQQTKDCNAVLGTDKDLAIYDCWRNELIPGAKMIPVARGLVAVVKLVHV